MDPITHGITGALIGKAFFAPEVSSTAADPARPDASASAGTKLRHVRRVAIFSATLGAIFPDGDVFFGFFSRNGLATLELHRGFTHSFLCMPLFAVALAALTRGVTHRFRIASPSFGALTLVYAAGISSHIVLDLITSFGTMIWSPLSNTRAALDLTFIIDFALTAIVLVPQVVAWAYRSPRGGVAKRIFGWAFFTLGAWVAFQLARRTGFGFSISVVWIASALFAALFFLPSLRQRGFGMRRATWCRAGVAVLVFYLGAQAGAHSVALRRVEQFAATQNLSVETLGALPFPPSLLHWVGMIRTRDGVWEARLDLRDASQPLFHYVADSPANRYIEAARALPSVKTYFWFARFPVVHYEREGDLHTVEFTDRRFFSRDGRRSGFTFRATFDSAGNVVREGWVAN